MIQKPTVIANLKANLAWGEIKKWLDEVIPVAKDFSGTIIFCPSAPFLKSASDVLAQQNANIHLGAQNISKFDQGPYTGETAASQISEFCKFAIIGHSERRNNLQEDRQTLEAKVASAEKANITPIFCVQDENTSIPNGVEIVAYEPIFAIGTGNPDTPQNAVSVSEKLKAKGKYRVLYGGSVDPTNVKSFLVADKIDGVLVGAGSKTPHTFLQILQNAKF